jgi:hypothetical protein
VRLNLNVKNSGNTAVAPDRVTLDVMDVFEKPIESLSDTTLEKIDAFATKEISAEFNSNLEKGQYRIDASVTFMGEVIARKKMVLTVNAKPTKVGEEFVQTQEEIPQKSDGRMLIVFAALAVFVLALAALVKALKGSVEGCILGEKFMKLLRSKLSKVLLAIVAIISMAVAVYFYLLLRSPMQVRQMIRQPVTKNEEVSPTNMPSQEASPSSEMEVKGASTKAEELVAPFVVNSPVSQGMYLVYDEPEFTSRVIYEAEDGETFDVITQRGDWVNIMLDNGTSGWLHKTSIKESN